MNTKARWGIGALLISAAAGYALWAGNRTGVPVGVPAESPKPSGSASMALTISPGSVDCGALKPGETREKTLSVQNRGRAPVTVYRIGASCDCMAGEMDDKVLVPGKTYPLKIRYTGVSGRGDYSGMVSLITDESGPCRYDVPVTGQVIENLFLEPGVLNFGQMAKGSQKTLETRLKHRAGTPFTITEARPDQAMAEVRWTPENSKSAEFKLAIEVKASTPGLFRITVGVKSDCADVPQLFLTLTGEVESELRCTPNSATLSLESSGRPLPLEFTIEHAKGESFKVKTIQESHGLPVEFTPSQTGPSRSKVSITLKELPQDGPPLGEFLITTDAQNEPLHIPYRIDSTLPRKPGGP